MTFSSLREKGMRLAQRLLSDESGNILIISAVAIPLLLAAAALAIDVNRVMKTGSYIQSAVDQAALAALSVDGQSRNEIAERFFNASLTEEVQSYINVESITVQENFPTGGPLSVKVTAQIRVTNALGGLVGLDSFTILRTGQASRAVQNVEAVITMASSSTMCATRERITNTSGVIPGDTLIRMLPDPACTNFNAMKTGVRQFTEILEQNNTVSNLKVGLVPYNFKVKMPNLGLVPPTMTAAEPAGYYTDLTGVEPLASVLPLTSNLDAVFASLNAMTQSVNAVAWSRSDLATHVAALMLDPAYSGYFPGIQAPAAHTDAATRKVIILMTDGANTGCCYTNWPLGNFSNQYLYFYKPYNDAQLQLCEQLKANKVTIFSILLDVKDNDAGGKEINNIFARCASGAYAEQGVESNPSAQLKCSQKQNCYNVANHEELIKVYRQIAQTFYKPVITE